MLTPLGKALRKLRIDHDWLLKDMADGIGVSSAFLSAVETGQKQAPADLLVRIARWGKLDAQTMSRLEQARDQSVREVTFNVNGASSEDKEAIAVLARAFGEMSEEKRAQL